MISSLKKRWLFAGLLFASLSLAMAQAPNGQVNFYFDRSTYPVWDFSGPYTFQHQVLSSGGTVLVAYPVNITQDLSGRLHGSGTTTFMIGSDVVAATYTLSGQVSLGGNTTRAIFSVHLRSDGADQVAGQNRKVTANFSYNLRVDPNPNDTPAWIAPAKGLPVRGSVSVAGIGSAPIVQPTDYTVPLPNGVNGSWFVTLNVLPLQQRLGGTASIVVNSYASASQTVEVTPYRVMSANLTGSYKAAQDLARIVLTALPGYRPASLRLNFISGATQPALLTGKLLGQTVRE